MNTTETESPLKSPSKIWKSEIENLRKKNPSKSRKSENIVARTVGRLARNSHENAGGSTGLCENHTRRAMPNGCSRTRERQAVFTAARKFICTKINPLI